MKTLRFCFCVITVLVCGVLSSSAQNYDDLESQIVGHWQSESFIIEVRSFEDTDTSFTVKVYADNWDMIMSTKPPVIIIESDGTFSSDVYDEDDKLVQQSSGYWWMDGDTLYMEDKKSTLYKYKVFIDGDLAEFRSWIDWDQDGKKDDHYFGVQKRKED